MTRRDAAADDADSQAHPTHPPESPRELTPDQISRWAELVAEGQEPMPGGLAPAAAEQMLQQVRRLRRARLVCYVARQLARDIAGEAGDRTEARNA
jgi:hypothetical protein